MTLIKSLLETKGQMQYARGFVWLKTKGKMQYINLGISKASYPYFVLIFVNFTPNLANSGSFRSSLHD